MRGSEAYWQTPSLPVGEGEGGEAGGVGEEEEEDNAQCNWHRNLQCTVRLQP